MRRRLAGYEHLHARAEELVHATGICHVRPPASSADADDGQEAVRTLQEGGGYQWLRQLHG